MSFAELFLLSSVGTGVWLKRKEVIKLKRRYLFLIEMQQTILTYNALKFTYVCTIHTHFRVAHEHELFYILLLFASICAYVLFATTLYV